MDIMFEIVSRQKFSASFPTSHVFGEAGGYIGRSEECEWVLPDRSRRISRRHALITYEDGAFYMRDVSANGVFLSLSREPIGRNRRHRIEHGEGFVFGDYTLMARLLHNPGTYAESPGLRGDDLDSLVEPLSLNPLTAMEQEEELVARRRMGDYDDLLRIQRSAAPAPADYVDPRIGRLQPINAVPEREEIIPEDWDLDPEDEDEEEPYDLAQVPSRAPAPPPPPPVAPAPPPKPVREVVAVPETEAFFKALGFAEPPDTPEERERVLSLAAELLSIAVDGLTRALQHRAECKNELRLSVTTTGLSVNYNPLKFSPTAEAAMAGLLGPPQKGVLPAAQAMRAGFADLHSHHMGLLAGARAAVRASLEKVSPQAVEARLDIGGPVRLNRIGKLWHTFIRLHQSLRDDDEGYAGLFLQDFARAYEVQGRTLAPHAGSQKGDTQ